MIFEFPDLILVMCLIFSVSGLVWHFVIIWYFSWIINRILVKYKNEYHIWIQHSVIIYSAYFYDCLSRNSHFMIDFVILLFVLVVCHHSLTFNYFDINSSIIALKWQARILRAIFLQLDDTFILFQLNTFRLPYFLFMKSELNVPSILTMKRSIISWYRRISIFVASSMI